MSHVVMVVIIFLCVCVLGCNSKYISCDLLYKIFEASNVRGIHLFIHFQTKRSKSRAIVITGLFHSSLPEMGLRLEEE